MLATRGPEFYSQLRIFAGILKKNHLGILKINAEVIDFSIYVFARILRTYKASLLVCIAAKAALPGPLFLCAQHPVLH